MIMMTPFCLDQLRGEAASGQQLSCHQAQPGGKKEVKLKLLFFGKSNCQHLNEIFQQSTGSVQFNEQCATVGVG